MGCLGDDDACFKTRRKGCFGGFFCPEDICSDLKWFQSAPVASADVNVSGLATPAPSASAPTSKPPLELIHEDQACVL